MHLRFTLHSSSSVRRGYYLYFSKILALSAIHFIAARLGLAMDAVSKFATLVWIPSGLAMATLLLFGRRLWPGVFLGAFLANYIQGASLLVAIGIGIGNTLEAVAGSYLLTRNGFHVTLDRLQDVLLP